MIVNSSGPGVEPGPPILLIDGRNLLYRAAFAADTQGHGHPFTYFLSQLIGIISQYQPASVHVFWDTPHGSEWRREIIPEYKVRPTSALTSLVSSAQKIALMAIPYLNIRQYSRPRMEADDLIYAAAVIMAPSSVVIASTDSDLLQIPSLLAHATVFNPKTMKETKYPAPPINLYKALAGDSTDCVAGYKGIGEKKSRALIADPLALTKFLTEVGDSRFKRNLSVVDLSYCPELLLNQIYIRKRYCAPVSLDKTKIMELAREMKIEGFVTKITPNWSVLARLS